MDSKSTSALVSRLLATPSFWSALASAATAHPYMLRDTDQWPNLRNCWKCLKIESALPSYFRTGLFCLNFPGTNTPSGSRRLITSNKGRPRCDPSTPGCLYLQSQRGQICHPACNGSRALSLFNGLAFPESYKAWRLEPSLVSLLGRVHF